MVPGQDRTERGASSTGRGLITQERSCYNDSRFDLPLDVTIHYADGTSETRIIQNDQRKQLWRNNLQTVASMQPPGVEEGEVSMRQPYLTMLCVLHNLISR